VYRGFFDPTDSPEGLPHPIPEDAPLVTDPGVDSFAYMMVVSEQTVMEAHRQGHYSATVLRFPMVYGPRQIIPIEWSIIRRLLDGRKRLIIPDGGLVMESRGFSGNMAHAVLLCVDHPEKAAGQIFNVAEEPVYTLREWIEMIASFMDREPELVNMPVTLAQPAYPYSVVARPRINRSGRLHHRVLDLRKIRAALGYKEPYHPREALKYTVEWYLEHRPEPGGEIEQRLRDSFNYEVEDRLIQAYQESLLRLGEIYRAPEYYHPYPHPRAERLERDHRGR